jgi:WXG100 family type VII secretion target
MASSVVGNNAYLKVTPDELKTKSTEVRSKISEMDGYLSQITNSMNTVSENWQSTSGDAYKEKAIVLVKEINESLTNLSYYVTDLNDAANKYEELETEIQGKVSALDDPSSIFNV